MDWFSWLSRTNLDPSLVYDYALEFARNELQSEDLVYFDHEFLLSMGITIAKHRLEILKLAKKEVGRGPMSLSKLFSAISWTKKGLKKRLAWWVYPQVCAVKALPEPEPEWFGEQRRGAVSLDRPPAPFFKPVRRQAMSGPLDRRRVQETYKLTGNIVSSLKLSGPLDGKVNERLVSGYWSPKLSGTPERVHPRLTIPQSRRSVSSNGYYSERTGNTVPDEHTLWPSLFQDMKPT